ncbi:5-formyltetrahydrofolate cyclo-ligase [Nitrosomonas sp. Is79A3]
MDNLLELRKHQRKQLIAARETLSEVTHQQWSQTISDLLKQGFPKLQKMNIGIYWPFRGEYDPRSIALYFMQHGATLALPEIVGKDKPLCFREWRPDAPLKNGAYGIPVPIEARAVSVDAIIIPVVGFDQHGYRLGYGSGYFDRTLATYHPQPLTIGIAFEMQRLENVYAQPHDIALHYIVTETGIFRTENHELKLIPASQCAEE